MEKQQTDSFRIHSNMTCYTIQLGDPSNSQSPATTSFIGGAPMLPSKAEVPLCKLCGASQTFFFQIAFPIDTHWEGLSLAVFACTSCVDENELIPQMLPGILKNATVPRAFMIDYQVNFQFLVFPTKEAVFLTKYKPLVKYTPLILVKEHNLDVVASKIGGNPSWILDDESPGVCDDTVSMVFLLQLLGDLPFEVVAGAPHQFELDLEGKPRKSRSNRYQLFVGNSVYMFGTNGSCDHLVYAITQVE